MANIFLISDTHFGQESIIGFCGRPFASAEEMDEAMVERWNKLIRPCDHVYHLGDVAMRRQALNIVQRLNGKKRVLLGNHDIYEAKYYFAAGFQKVGAVRVMDNMILTHIPIHPGSLGRFLGNIHGHLHERPSPPGMYLNVCVERINYAPVSLEEAKRVLLKRKEEVA
jgi:calcineurin-like phosphoesterase family protein